MTRNKILLIAQSLLCLALVVMLAVGAVGHPVRDRAAMEVMATVPRLHTPVM